MKVLVCGSREWDDWPKIKTTLDELNEKYKFSEVIHGGAQGVDRLAGVWARWYYIKETVFPADWKQFGKRAGYVRNSQMLEEGKPDIVVVFPGGKGTNMMRKLAEDAGVEVVVIE